MSVPADPTFSTAICYITAVSGSTTWQASGVIIGPHTVLTASHVLWDGSLQKAMTDVRVYPGYSQGGALIPGAFQIHYNPIDDANHTLTKAASAQDFAVIDFATDLTAYGHFDVQAGYAGGTVHATGYPGTSRGVQVDRVGTVTADASYGVLDHGTLTVQGGNSGGPLWFDAGTATLPDPTVVGIVSTSGWATQLTAADLNAIRSWQASDAFLWAPASPSASGGSAAVPATVAPPAAPPVAASGAGASVVYRFYDTATGDHFYTTNPGEHTTILATLPSYHDEGTPWASPTASAVTTNVYRFYDTATGSHFFTADAAERDSVLATLSTYRDEGVGFQAYGDAVAPGTAGTVTLERFLNTATGQHHYATPDEAALMLQGSAGPAWVDEGRAFTVHTAAGLS